MLEHIKYCVCMMEMRRNFVSSSGDLVTSNKINRNFIAKSTEPYNGCVCVCMHVCMRACMHACMRVRVHVRVCIYSTLF